MRRTNAADGTGWLHGHPRVVAVGVADRHDRVGERGQRRAGVDPDGLARLQPPGLPRSGRDLADHRQQHRLGAGRLDVHAAYRVAVDGRLVEAGQRAFGDDLLGAQQALCLGDGHPYRRRTNCGGKRPAELLVD